MIAMAIVAVLVINHSCLPLLPAGNAGAYSLVFQHLPETIGAVTPLPRSQSTSGKLTSSARIPI